MATSESGEVKLIASLWSPFVVRPKVALNLKGIQYELLLEKFPEKSELLLKSNPVYKKVPVLLHNNMPICESLVIVEYIDEVWSTFGMAILSKDPYDRAVQRFWVAFIEDKLSSVFKGLMAQTKETTTEAVEQLFTTFNVLEGAFEKCSKGKTLFNGDNIGYIDIALGGYIGWLKACEKLIGFNLFDKVKFPHLVEWVERFCTHDAVKGVIPETEKIMEYAKKYFATP